MDAKSLKQEVFEANKALVEEGLVFMTWGNASGVDRERGLVAIKPSGVPYDAMDPGCMAVVDLEGVVVEGDMRPSVDTPTHLALYKAFPQIGGIAHTHSHHATCWAQACRPIPCLGTTHADYCYGEVPVTDLLTEQEVAEDYERNIGEVIIRRFRNLNPVHFPGVLVAQHGPFAWGRTVSEAVSNAYVLEEIARMAVHTFALEPGIEPIPQFLLDKHFLRKHGHTAYYGQDTDV